VYTAAKVAVLKSFPIVPASAMTFALVQGQEFQTESVAVHFPVGEGIAYTVLSRARESKHLYVENFRKEHVQVHMEALKSVQILSVEAYIRFIQYCLDFKKYLDKLDTPLGLPVGLWHLNKQVEGTARRIQTCVSSTGQWRLCSSY